VIAKASSAMTTGGTSCPRNSGALRPGINQYLELVHELLNCADYCPSVGAAGMRSLLLMVFMATPLRAKLRERGRNASRESGAFLLGYRVAGPRPASPTSSCTTISTRER
jgi:hypothetical protein